MRGWVQRAVNWVEELGDGGVLAVITLSIRPQDGLHQPTGLMFDRIIRKLSRPVITGAHLAEEDFHSPSATHAHTNTHKPASHLWLTGIWDSGLIE